MRKKIHEFLNKKDEKKLEIKHKKDENTLYDWPKVRNPIKIMFNYCIMKLCKILPLHVKIFFYKTFLGVKIGKNVAISAESEFDSFYPELITIEDNVILGLGAKILTHEFTHRYFRFARTTIKKDALVGAFSIVRSGVVIGENSVVAMNSFVSKDIPKNEVWGGVPAKLIKKK